MTQGEEWADKVWSLALEYIEIAMTGLTDINDE